MARRAEVLPHPTWATWRSWFAFQFYLLLFYGFGKLCLAMFGKSMFGKNISEPQIPYCEG